LLIRVAVEVRLVNVLKRVKLVEPPRAPHRARVREHGTLLRPRNKDEGVHAAARRDTLKLAPIPPT
jgi:hypothetical protein